MQMEIENANQIGKCQMNTKCENQMEMQNENNNKKWK
jgi:hypothetical protein